MATPKLRKYLPDAWYSRQRLYHDIYIERNGQIVKLIRRTNVETNQYHDIMFADIDVIDTKAIMNRDTVMDSFLGTPLGAAQNEMIIYGFFKISDYVKADDLVVFELKSVEEELKRFVYEVTLLKSWNYEQEIMRKYLLTPIRDNRVMMIYTDEGIDLNPPTTEGTRFGDVERLRYDVLSSPGKFSVGTDELYQVPSIELATADEINNPVVPEENLPESIYDLIHITDSTDHRNKSQFIESLLVSESKLIKRKSPFERDLYE